MPNLSHDQIQERLFTELLSAIETCSSGAYKESHKRKALLAYNDFVVTGLLPQDPDYLVRRDEIDSAVRRRLGVTTSLHT